MNNLSTQVSRLMRIVDNGVLKAGEKYSIPWEKMSLRERWFRCLFMHLENKCTPDFDDIIRKISSIEVKNVCFIIHIDFCVPRFILRTGEKSYYYQGDRQYYIPSQIDCYVTDYIELVKERVDVDHTFGYEYSNYHKTYKD